MSEYRTFQGQLSTSQSHENGSEVAVGEIRLRVKSIYVCPERCTTKFNNCTCFNHDLDKPTVKRHSLGNKGKFEQENNGKVSLSWIS